jgi:hypothetical protein
LFRGTGVGNGGSGIFKGDSVMSLESTITGGFGWKHALVIVGLGILGAALYQANPFGVSGIAQKVAGTVKGITG